MSSTEKVSKIKKNNNTKQFSNDYFASKNPCEYGYFRSRVYFISSIYFEYLYDTNYSSDLSRGKKLYFTIDYIVFILNIVYTVVNILKDDLTP